MEAHRIETVVQSNNRVVLENLPFDEGDEVEVIILETKGSRKDENRENPYPLRGTPYRYDDPFSPLFSLEDWKPLE
mgnify:CR=1 FL=1